MDSKMICEWCKQKEVLISLKKKGTSSCRWQCAAGRKVIDVDLEEALFSWIVELCSCNLCVSRKMIQQQGRLLSCTKDFHAG